MIIEVQIHPDSNVVILETLINKNNIKMYVIFI
jgi:hypothetical protein